MQFGVRGNPGRYDNLDYDNDNDNDNDYDSDNHDMTVRTGAPQC